MDPIAKRKLKKAYNKRDFTQCINIFKKYFDESTLDSYSACIVGISFLYKFDFEKAKKYLELSLNLDSSNVKAMMGLAALNLKQKNFETATEYYLKILEIDENNKLAHRILDKLRKTENIDKFVRKMRYRDFIQLPPLYIPILSILTLVLVIVVIILLIVFIFVFW